MRRGVAAWRRGVASRRGIAAWRCGWVGSYWVWVGPSILGNGLDLPCWGPGLDVSVLGFCVRLFGRVTQAILRAHTRPHTLRDATRDARRETRGPRSLRRALTTTRPLRYASPTQCGACGRRGTSRSPHALTLRPPPPPRAACAEPCAGCGKARRSSRLQQRAST